MNNILSINSYCMQNSEFLGLMQKFLVFAESLSGDELRPSVAAFRFKVDVLKNHIGERFSETEAHAAKRLHEERLAAYSALRHSVKGLVMAPDASLKAAGARYWNIIEKTDDPRRANQDAVTHLFRGIIDAFHAFDESELIHYGVQVYVNLMERLQTEYIEAAKARGEVAKPRIDNATRMYRKGCFEAFNVLRFYAYARAVSHGDEECMAFVEECNGEMELRKRQLKARKTLAKKEAEGVAENAAVEGAAEGAAADVSNAASPAAEFAAAESPAAEFAAAECAGMVSVGVAAEESADGAGLPAVAPAGIIAAFGEYDGSPVADRALGLVG